MQNIKSEKIRMMAEFKNGVVTPLIFEWSGRNYKIKKVNLRYQEREGASINYFFSVETDAGVFTLRYNDQKMRWWIAEQWVD